VIGKVKKPQFHASSDPTLSKADSIYLVLMHGSSAGNSLSKQIQELNSASEVTNLLCASVYAYIFGFSNY